MFFFYFDLKVTESFQRDRKKKFVRSLGKFVERVLRETIKTTGRERKKKVKEKGITCIQIVLKTPSRRGTVLYDSLVIIFCVSSQKSVSAKNSILLKDETF